jgi:hypothetical protein
MDYSKTDVRARLDRLVVKTANAIREANSAPTSRTAAYKTADARIEAYGEAASDVLGLCQTPAAYKTADARIEAYGEAASDVLGLCQTPFAWRMAVRNALVDNPRPGDHCGYAVFQAWAEALTAAVMEKLDYPRW